VKRRQLCQVQEIIPPIRLRPANAHFFLAPDELRVEHSEVREKEGVKWTSNTIIRLSKGGAKFSMVQIVEELGPKLRIESIRDHLSNPAAIWNEAKVNSYSWNRATRVAR